MLTWLSVNPFGAFRSFNRRSTDRAAVDRELAWRALPWPAQLYVFVVIVGGLCVPVALSPRPFPNRVLLFVLLAWPALPPRGRVTLPIPKTSGSTLSVSYAA